MATEKQRLIFISYSRTNRGFALELARELKASGFRVWFDQLDIPTGARWDDEIEKALTECEIFMVILTPQSIASNNVKDEIGYAIDSNKRILPILLEHANVPFRLRRFQYVDFTNKSNNEGIDAAKQLLRKLINEPTGPVPASVSTNTPSPQPDVDRSAALQAEANRLARQKAEAIRRAREQEQRERSAQVAYQAPPPVEKPQSPSKKPATPKLRIVIIGIVAILVVCLGAWGVVAVMTDPQPPTLTPTPTNPPKIPTTITPTNTPTDTPTSTQTPLPPGPAPITDTPTFTPVPGIPPTSEDPVQFVADYWSNVSNGYYDMAWKYLSPDFRKTANENNFGSYKAGYEARNYCRIETSNGYLVNNNGSSVVVSMQVTYYTGQSCTKALHTFDNTLIYDNVDQNQMWQYDKLVDLK